MIPFHIKLQIKNRGLPFNESDLERIAQKCIKSTAVLLAKLNNPILVKNSPDKRTESNSNGDLIILIVRERKPITIMFRRSNQPFTPSALKVEEILNLI